MPIFEYHCPKCGANFEKIVRSSDAQVPCPCGHELKRQIGKSNFQLKGTGWFKDGYK
jgi:putative FmdB family regulatory protein